MTSLLLSTFRLQQILLRYPLARCYWIAFSGGMDSHVLLHLCACLRDEQEEPLKFHAVHVHHGLQKAADVWVAHCAKVCRDLNMSFTAIQVDASAKPGESPEEMARLARYTALRGHMLQNDIVLTAQHLDDQAETLLLQLVRGAGLAGLAGMPEYMPLGHGFLFRPLLKFPRNELWTYAVEKGLSWIDDPSNVNTQFDRNFLRQEIIPKLEERWPSINKALSRSAGLCAEAQEQLRDLSKDLYRSALNADGQSLKVSVLQNFRVTDQRLVLREWLRMQGFRMPSQVITERILQEVLLARPDKMPIVSWSQGQVRRYRDAIFLLSVHSRFEKSAVLDWDGYKCLQLPDENGELSAETAISDGVALESWQKGSITVRYRQGGERCRLVGRRGTHELKKLFQEAGILPWMRERVPLIYISGELAVVAGIWVCEPFAGKAGEPQIKLIWRTESVNTQP